MKTKKGFNLYRKAKKIILNGNMLLSKRPEMILPEKWPTYFSKANDIYVTDLDNNTYLDMMCIVGHNILGYGNNKIDQRVIKEIKKGNMCSLNSEYEVLLAEKLIKLHPWAKKCTFARSGGEANAIAIRIARAYNKKDNIAVCGYHGWHDWYLSLNLENPKNLNTHLLKGLSTDGVPKKLKGLTSTFNYGDFEKLKKIHKLKKLSAVIMEVCRDTLPDEKFLKNVRNFTKKNNIVLIFDECTTGFRRCLGGIHKTTSIQPDLAMFGKALGNGYAITAVLGSKKIMDKTSKSFISSTFWSEKIGFVAGLSTIEEMEKTKSWKKIIYLGKYINKEWLKLKAKYNLDFQIKGIESMTSFVFKKNHLKYKTFITQEMLKNNILATNMIFLTTKHDKKKINRYLKNLDIIFKKIFYIEKNNLKIDNFIESPVCHDTFKRLN
jgi:glutamate-1-semialdehyde 2,1-aminomutase